MVDVRLFEFRGLFCSPTAYAFGCVYLSALTFITRSQAPPNPLASDHVNDLRGMEQPSDLDHFFLPILCPCPAVYNFALHSALCTPSPERKS
ncbi:hypothetical protein QQP08_024214 [Theobroma cacao]|nr:hypothetical protein QQP08_024214 [Theobroma cacao]